MGTKRYELTDSEWKRVKDMLPPEHPAGGKRGRPAKCDNRTALNGMLWIARGGAPWRELPERYGPWQTVYSRFRTWRDMGVFEAVFQALSIDADFENISIDSTSCKVHQSANGGEKTENKAVGVSRGGRNTKIHALVDGLGNPLAFLLSSGNDHDSKHAIPLLSQIDIEGSNIWGVSVKWAKKRARRQRALNHLAGRQFSGAFHGSSLDAQSGSAWDNRGASVNNHVR